MKKYKPYLTRVDLVKNQVERERIQEQEAAKKRKQRIQEQNRQNHLRYQEQLRSEMAARYFHSVISTGGESFSNTKSLNFDGVDDYVVSNAAYTHLSSGTAMSVSLWFKSSVYTTLGRLLFVGKHVEIKQNSALYSNTQGTFSYILKGNFGNSFATLGGGTNLGVGNLVDGNWHHICFTWDGATTTAKVYEDGVLKVTNASATGTLNNSTIEKYSVGAQNNGSNPNGGLADEVAIWTTALSADDVTAIYNSGVPNNLDDLSATPITWWRFEEGSGTTAIDSGTGGNNGTLEGPPTYSTDIPS